MKYYILPKTLYTTHLVHHEQLTFTKKLFLAFVMNLELLIRLLQIDSSIRKFSLCGTSALGSCIM